MTRTIVWTAIIVASIVLLIGSYLRWLPFGLTEALAFASGAICVWLVVEQNVWNYPVGLANNVFFIVLFLNARLYGDMSLQVIYIVLAIHGWYEWTRGGEHRTVLLVGRARRAEWAWLALVGMGATAGLTAYFVRIGDSAPLLDALTTVMSLVAQYLLNMKRLENWLVWIVADVIYIGLYVSRGLYLTAGLYAIFIAMCVAGFLAWRSELSARRTLTPTEEVAA